MFYNVFVCVYPFIQLAVQRQREIGQNYTSDEWYLLNSEAYFNARKLVGLFMFA